MTFSFGFVFILFSVQVKSDKNRTVSQGLFYQNILDYWAFLFVYEIVSHEQVFNVMILPTVSYIIRVFIAAFLNTGPVGFMAHAVCLEDNTQSLFFASANR